MVFFEKLNRSRYMQYIAALTATLSITCSSVYITWSSPTLPKLTSSDSPIGTTLTNYEASWVASIGSLATVPGAFLAAWGLAKFGRKPVLFVSAIAMFFPWLAIIYAKSASTLYIARLVAGVSACTATVTVPIYVGEISEDDIRGKLGTMFNLMRISGSLFVLSVGPFVSYTTLAICCSVFPLLFIVLFGLMPESPYYLVQTNETDKARHNLKQLSISSVDNKMVQAKLDEIEYIIERDMIKKSTLWELLTKQEYRKALVIMTGVKVLQHCNGTIAIESYMQTIIKASRSSISPEISSIIFGIIQIPAVLMASVLVDKIGRRPLFILSALGCALALSAEGLYFYIQDTASHTSLLDSISWLPTTSLLIFLVMNSVGMYTLPYVLLGEFFPTNVKSHAVSMFAALGGILGFTVIKFFEPVSTAWGMYTIFWIFTTVCILGAVFIFFMLPETKGKSFIEIQHILNNTSSDLTRISSST